MKKLAGATAFPGGVAVLPIAVTAQATRGEGATSTKLSGKESR